MNYSSLLCALQRLLLLFFLVSSLAAHSQQVRVSSGRGVVYPEQDQRIDFLVMMYDIAPDDEISIVLPNGTFTVNWLKYYPASSAAGGQSIARPSLISNQRFINPEDMTGYIVRIDGTMNGSSYQKELTVWVVDYKSYLPVLSALEPAITASREQCNELTLRLTGNVPDLVYYTPLGLRYSLDRFFELQFESLEWTDQWSPKIIQTSLKLYDNQITVSEPPMQNTYFRLSGDQYATDLGLEAITVQSSFYQAIKVEGRILTEASVRTEKQEADRPETIQTLSGSAPLEILFTAKGNEPVANFYRWTILKNGEPYVSRTDASHRFTFKEAGTYAVQLTTENAWCTHTDSVVIKVSESAIYAPNVFTPNGDGINDEFRVAYRSIIEFQCWIYNRWGAKVYEWNDPQKGWDGTINGRPASQGAYFYVIRALGSDGIVYNLKGDINLLRGKP